MDYFFFSDTKYINYLMLDNMQLFPSSLHIPISFFNFFVVRDDMEVLG